MNYSKCIAIIFILITVNSIELKAQFECGDILQDIEGNLYGTVKIGSQCWMADNLRTSTFANGDKIERVANSKFWESIKFGAWSYFNGDNKYNVVYGKLYNGYAVVDSRNICPYNWHVATDNDWKELEHFLGMPKKDLNNTSSRGMEENIASKLKSTGSEYWGEYNNGTNESGFWAQPGGIRMSYGYFLQLGGQAFWWTSTPLVGDEYNLWHRNISSDGHQIWRWESNKNYGLSVRCLRDR